MEETFLAASFSKVTVKRSTAEGSLLNAGLPWRKHGAAVTRWSHAVYVLTEKASEGEAARCNIVCTA